MIHISRASIFAFVVTLQACSSPVEPDNYYPLQKGLQWTYLVNNELGEYSTQRYLKIVNLRRQDFNGSEVTVRRTSDGTDYLITANETGTYRIGKRRVIEEKAKKDPTARMVIPYPGSLQLDQSWSSSSIPYAIHRRHPYETGMNRNIKLQMTYVLAGTQDKVTVPAGEFTRCLRVEGSGQISIYADAKDGYQDIHITTTEWYAPGVGLIKLVRNEPLDTDVFRGGTITLELTSFGT